MSPEALCDSGLGDRGERLMKVGFDAVMSLLTTKNCERARWVVLRMCGL